MKSSSVTLVIILFVSAGCPAAGTPVVPGPAAASSQEAAGSSKSQPTPDVEKPKKIPAERLVWAYIDGKRQAMDLDDAQKKGLTIIDLSNDFVPYIFWPQTPGKEDYSHNTYLDTYVDLANDRIDVDGVDLAKWQRNYLEVYGIPPSLSVLRKRFLSDETKECFKSLEYSAFSEYHGSIRIVDPAGSAREQKRFYSARGAYKKALQAARVKTLEALLAKPAFRRVAENYRKQAWRHKAIRQMQKRLACEGMFGRRTPNLKPGVITWATRQALRLFERKHNIYSWGMMFQDTVTAMGNTPRQNNFESLKRVITERVITAARILEDGTIRKFTYKTLAGKKEGIRNLVEEFSFAALKHLGLTDADKALEFMKLYSHKDFSRMWVAVKLPKKPEYYSDNMDFRVVINRGDIWYDFPFDASGKRLPQPRGRFPHLTLYVNHAGNQIPLVRWKTTIGSWQPEMRHEQEYYKYKISDVGPRIWKNIVAGPVWVPPRMTPSRDMVKVRAVSNQTQRIVAHQAFGPGYASAYGLVAAFHITPGGHDNQVRTHGSVNYMSIKSNKFSHGCHRLFNYRAVRLFSFLLGHRPFKRLGQSRLAFNHRFEHKGEEFQIDLRTRGYYYELTPPVPVNVLEGRIRGKVLKPIEKYLKKPTVVYQEDLPSLKGKTSTGAPRIKKKNKGLMTQEQTL